MLIGSRRPAKRCRGVRAVPETGERLRPTVARGHGRRSSRSSSPGTASQARRRQHAGMASDAREVVRSELGEHPLLSARYRRGPANAASCSRFPCTGRARDPVRLHHDRQRRATVPRADPAPVASTVAGDSPLLDRATFGAARGTTDVAVPMRTASITADVDSRLGSARNGRPRAGHGMRCFRTCSPAAPGSARSFAARTRG